MSGGDSLSPGGAEVTAGWMEWDLIGTEARLTTGLLSDGNMQIAGAETRAPSHTRRQTQEESEKGGASACRYTHTRTHAHANPHTNIHTQSLVFLKLVEQGEWHFTGRSLEEPSVSLSFEKQQEAAEPPMIQHVDIHPKTKVESFIL